MNIMVSDIQPCNTYSPEQCHSNTDTHVAQCTLPAFGFKNHQINTFKKYFKKIFITQFVYSAVLYVLAVITNPNYL